ncbi:MAG: hypothetical protein ABFC80_03770 [Coriobacteriales bacterium]|jgi:hypothetical protein
MIKSGHIGAACAFRDLGFSPEAVKDAFIKQGMAEDEADYLVKEAWGFLAGLATKAIPWITKGVSAISKAAPWASKAVGGVGTAAKTSLTSFANKPLSSLGGGALNFGKGMFFMGSKNPSIANMAGKGYGMYGMGQMVLGPGSTPMPTPQMGQYGSY